MNDAVEPQDTVEYNEKRFGTYNVLLQLEDWRPRDRFAGAGDRE